MFGRVANTVGFLYISELIRIKLPLPQFVFLALSRQLESIALQLENHSKENAHICVIAPVSVWNDNSVSSTPFGKEKLSLSWYLRGAALATLW